MKHKVVRNLLEKLAKEALGSGARVLDLGGGSGVASFPWMGKGLDITVVDSSEEMLSLYKQREPTARLISADLSTWLENTDDTFDLVAVVSTLHHIPDYLSALRRVVRLVAPGGSLLTFQDPLLYARLGPTHTADQLAYYSWRITRGRFGEGMKTFSRRVRGVYDPSKAADFEEYHVVRGGVDEQAVVGLLSPSFESVQMVRYWATQGSIQQALGDLFRLAAQFSVVAKNRRPVGN